jgi:hypothetical protein
MNLNKFAKDIALAEGLKKSLSIAQIKEVIRLTLFGLKDLTVDELIGLLRRIK